MHVCESQYLVRQHVTSSQGPDEHCMEDAAALSASPAELQVYESQYRGAGGKGSAHERPMRIARSTTTSVAFIDECI